MSVTRLSWLNVTMNSHTMNVRLSILSLFDPLNASGSAPSTPSRVTASPESDKENSVPNYGKSPRASSTDESNMTMTTFFNRIRQKQPFSQPQTPTGCLIDFGGVTTGDASVDLLGLDEELPDTDGRGLTQVSGETVALSTIQDLILDDVGNLCSTPSRNECEKAPPIPRTPFAELQVERQASPMARKKLYRREILARPPAEPVLTVTRAPLGSPLASVINAINFPDEPVEDAQAVVKIVDQEIESHFDAFSPMDTLTPEITISTPSERSLSPCSISSDDLAEPLSNLMLSETTNPLPTVIPSPLTCEVELPPESLVIPPARPRPRPPIDAHAKVQNLESSDPRRNSIDLHTSFDLQLHNPEISFDLLNDRISFIGYSALGLDEGSFDGLGEAEMMQVLARKFGKEAQKVDDSFSESSSMALMPRAYSQLGFFECSPPMGEQSAQQHTPAPGYPGSPSDSSSEPSSLDKTVRPLRRAVQPLSSAPASPTSAFGLDTKYKPLIKMPSPLSKLVDTDEVTESKGLFDTDEVTESTGSPFSAADHSPPIARPVFVPPPRKEPAAPPQTPEGARPVQATGALRIMKRQGAQPNAAPPKSLKSSTSSEEKGPAQAVLPSGAARRMRLSAYAMPKASSAAADTGYQPERMIPPTQRATSLSRSSGLSSSVHGGAAGASSRRVSHNLSNSISGGLAKSVNKPASTVVAEPTRAAPVETKSRRASVAVSGLKPPGRFASGGLPRPSISSGSLAAPKDSITSGASRTSNAAKSANRVSASFGNVAPARRVPYGGTIRK